MAMLLSYCARFKGDYSPQRGMIGPGIITDQLYQFGAGGRSQKV